MGRRRYKRLRIALPVTISGLDANGNPFTQSATTVDIGVHGMRLRGVRCVRAPGDPVEVRYKNRRATYSIAWIGQPGTCWDGLLGLAGLDGATFLFADHVTSALRAGPDLTQDNFTLPAAVPPSPALDHAGCQVRHEERRRYVRYGCAGVARIWETGSEDAITARVNEISMGGCYIEMMSPQRLGSPIRLELEVAGRTIRAEAVVRLAQPTCGMGVEFTRIGFSEADKLHHVIAEVSGQSSPAAPVEPAPVKPAAIDPVPVEPAPIAIQELSPAPARSWARPCCAGSAATTCSPAPSFSASWNS